MLGVPLLDPARDSACKFARCPICFDSLHARPEAVGALTFKGKRVESALYHKDCMVDEVGALRLSASLSPPWRRSPVSRKEVDGFALLPPVSKHIAWSQFIDWNCDGIVSISEIAVAIAALLPIDADHAEEFVSSNFDEDGKGELNVHEVRDLVLPFIQKSKARIIATAAQPPEIHRTSSRVEFLSWFDYWDKAGSGQLSDSCLQVALAASLASVCTVPMRRTLAAVIMAEAGIEGNIYVSRAMFLEQLAPVLQLNLPEKDEASDTPIFDPKGPLRISLVSCEGKRKQALVPASATVGTLRAEVRRQYRVWLASKDAQLTVMGEVLLDDSVKIAGLAFFPHDCVVQVSRKAKVVGPALKSHHYRVHVGVTSADLDEWLDSCSDDTGSGDEWLDDVCDDDVSSSSTHTTPRLGRRCL